LAADGARYPWTVCAFGYREHACALTAAAMGGHIRVGFENNLHLKDGTLAPDNAALVADVAAAVRALGRPLADADESAAASRADRLSRAFPPTPSASG
jgi:3-keto-5-aminohexanoate cleavage enzyme